MAQKLTEKQIWDYLITNVFPDNPAAVAGMMGNIEAESTFDPQAIAASTLKQIPFASTRDEYTAQADKSKSNWDYKWTGSDGKKHSVAYGYVQWLSANRRDDLYNFAKRHGKSVGDPYMQLDFIKAEMQKSPYSKAYDQLKDKNITPSQAAKIIFEKYEIALDSTLSKRQANAERIYKAYYGTDTAAPQNENNIDEATAKSIDDAMQKAAKELGIELDHNGLYYWIKGDYKDNPDIAAAEQAEENCNTGTNTNTGSEPTNSPTTPTNQTCEIGVKNTADIAIQKDIPSSINYKPEGGLFPLSTLIKAVSLNGKSLSQATNFANAVSKTEAAHKNNKHGPLDYLIFLDQQLLKLANALNWDISKIQITSGYRDKAVQNSNSHHTEGLAVDIKYNGGKHYPECYKIAKLIEEGRLCSRQILWEYRSDAAAGSIERQGIIHFALAPMNDWPTGYTGFCIAAGVNTSPAIKVRDIKSVADFEKGAASLNLKI